MNHNFNADDVRRHFNGKPRKPLRTGPELAQELGVSPRSLAGKLGADPNAPKPKINNRNTSTKSRHTWYDPDEVRAWWKAHNA